jgi:hypothetical protein
MTNDEIRNKILKVLYADYQEFGHDSSISWEDFSAKIPSDQKTVHREFDYLAAKGLIECPCLGHVAILPDGIDKVEKSPEFSSASAGFQKIEIHGGSIGQINQAHIINNPSQLLNQLADAIQKADSIDPQKKESWVKSLWEMSKHPVVAEAVKKLLSSWNRGRTSKYQSVSISLNLCG